MSEKQVVNPESNRYIRVGGPTYRKLVLKGVFKNRPIDIPKKRKKGKKHKRKNKHVQPFRKANERLLKQKKKRKPKKKVVYESESSTTESETESSYTSDSSYESY